MRKWWPNYLWKVLLFIIYILALNNKNKSLDIILKDLFQKCGDRETGEKLLKNDQFFQDIISKLKVPENDIK